MHLKSLTLRGFKSFASSTTLRFEPGHHLRRRPERLRQVQRRRRPRLGHGRAGRQDACAAARWRTSSSPAPPAARRWAGPRSSLTIDNTDGALPIDYAEVTISRIMFRNGGSRVRDQRRALPAARRPGAAVRLRHRPRDARHRRPGPARPGAVTPTPEERRGFIEEAAGVLKHRKRKEKALRKLEAMQANLTRRAGPHRRAAPPAQAARPAGRGRPPGRRHPGRPARRPAAAARRRPA